MTEVKKKSGAKEQFDAEKIRRSIQKAVIDAGSTVEKKAEVIEEASEAAIKKAMEQGEVTTVMLRDKTLEKLDEFDASAAEAWRKFDMKYKQVGHSVKRNAKKIASRVRKIASR